MTEPVQTTVTTNDAFDLEDAAALAAYRTFSPSQRDVVRSVIARMKAHAPPGAEVLLADFGSRGETFILNDVFFEELTRVMVSIE